MNQRILILDDEADVLEAYAGILTPAPTTQIIRSSRSRQKTAVATSVAPQPQTFEVTYVKSGMEAISAIEQSLATNRPYAGGFFDVKLGGELDGIETICRVKDLDPDLLCTIVTAYQDRGIEEITKIFGEGFSDRWDFINKPFTHAEILQKTKNLVANWDRRKREKEYIQKIEAQQEQLILSERLAAVGTLARGIGHEFGNILLSIMGNADLALQSKKPKEMEEALQVVAKSSERASIIIRNLQSMVKMESKRAQCDPRIPLKESLQLVGHELKKKNVKVVENYTESLPHPPINKVEMGQVFLNLTINAIHAMEPKGGEIRIGTKESRGGYLIEFSDTGCGISTENMKHIFDPLFTTKGVKGSGIGLSVSKKIIENHGGLISVKSAPGKGTTFSIWLPNQ